MDTAPPQFSAHVCCGQTAGWIKMSLGTDVGLGPGDIVLDGDPAPHNKKMGHSSPPPHLDPSSRYGQTAGWIKMPLGTEVGLGPGHVVLDGDPAPRPPAPKGAQQPPLFGLCLLWPNVRPSQQLLSSCLSSSTADWTYCDRVLLP